MLRRRCRKSSSDGWMSRNLAISILDAASCFISSFRGRRIAVVHLQQQHHNDIFNHPPRRLDSRFPLWTGTASSNLTEAWFDSWESATVVNQSLATDPIIRQTGFNLPCQTVLARVFVPQTYTSGAWHAVTSADVGWTRQCHIQQMSVQ